MQYRDFKTKSVRARKQFCSRLKDMHALEIWCMDVGVNTMTLINEHYYQNVKAETENEIMVSIDEKLLIVE